MDEADEERATYNTPLMEAAANGRAGCVARLLDAQADINKVRWLVGWLVGWLRSGLLCALVESSC